MRNTTTPTTTIPNKKKAKEEKEKKEEKTKQVFFHSGAGWHFGRWLAFANRSEKFGVGAPPEEALSFNGIFC